MMSKKTFWIAGSGIAALLVAAVAVWYFVLRDDAPPEVSLAGALETLTQTPEPTGTPASAGLTTTSVPEQTATPSPPEDFEGRWIVDAESQSFVGYRVREELATVGFTTAVGRTTDVTGSFLVSENEVMEATVEADLTLLKSDAGFRDNALRTQALETNDFPSATFTLTSPITLPPVEDALQPFLTTLAGDLTLHGVTRAVEIAAEAQLSGDLLVVIGQLDVLFADYEIDQPNARNVLSVEDNGVMELQLFFRRP